MTRRASLAWCLNRTCARGIDKTIQLGSIDQDSSKRLRSRWISLAARRRRQLHGAENATLNVVANCPCRQTEVASGTVNVE